MALSLTILRIDISRKQGGMKNIQNLCNKILYYQNYSILWNTVPSFCLEMLLPLITACVVTVLLYSRENVLDRNVFVELVLLRISCFAPTVKPKPWVLTLFLFIALSLIGYKLTNLDIKDLRNFKSWKYYICWKENLKEQMWSP